MPNASTKSATTAASGTTETTLTAEEVKRFTFLSGVVLIGQCVSALTVNKNAKTLIDGFTESLAVITVLDLGSTLMKKRKEKETAEEEEIDRKAEEFSKKFGKKN